MSGYYIYGNLYIVARDVLCLGITYMGTYTLCVMSGYYLSGNLYIVAQDVLCLGITYLGTYTLWREMCYVWVVPIWEPIHCGARCAMSGYYISGNLYIVARDVLCLGITYLGTYTLWPEMCYVWVLPIWKPIHCGARCVMSGYYIYGNLYIVARDVLCLGITYNGNLYIVARDVLCLGITYLETYTLWREMCYVWVLHIWEPIHCGPRCVMSGYNI